jgi:hypothetical protein
MSLCWLHYLRCITASCAVNPPAANQACPLLLAAAPCILVRRCIGCQPMQAAFLCRQTTTGSGQTHLVGICPLLTAPGGALLRYKYLSCIAVGATAAAMPTVKVTMMVATMVLWLARRIRAEMRLLSGPGSSTCSRLMVACMGQLQTANHWLHCVFRRHNSDTAWGPARAKAHKQGCLPRERKQQPWAAAGSSPYCGRQRPCPVMHPCLGQQQG